MKIEYNNYYQAYIALPVVSGILRRFTVLFKDDGCKRGEYIEEIDVLARTVGGASKIVQVALDRGDYGDELRIGRVAGGHDMAVRAADANSNTPRR